MTCLIENVALVFAAVVLHSLTDATPLMCVATSVHGSIGESLDFYYRYTDVLIILHRASGLMSAKKPRGHVMPRDVLVTEVSTKRPQARESNRKLI